ncbi:MULTISPECIES: SDR family oxidoreductase [unclassified Devosia]|jgi:NAD(P)-dependent dehydrogenase (short-subunit alcohol dehydrogenase family)|uniref:SDR family NAD(P)-dependent oxidoreductase n=1 Tax=unclassified Devosia TaxID=196773 RepID=UPI00086C76DE|nr:MULTISPECIES: SDR family oxidoreductase [unclassified Devosia]MBN9364754.1 SDR family oxidoreductase [Devosia sp.]ODS81740.1 MAG: short-chain dehydrogenase [Devosia sp. SCN 66-27]OJX25609.1 MAG: short-chain dehydrogenase [Devosia sp. 66-14]
MSKVVVVTGGASGIGEATARRFAAGGWTVEIADQNASRGKQICLELDATYEALDVADEASVKAYAAAVLQRRGQVDAVVNSAGVLQNAVRITEMEMAEFDRIHAINVRGTLLVNRAFGAAMSAAGSGAIVNMGSLTTYRPSGQPAYAMGKASIKMLTEIMAAEFGPSGVRVNAVAPGYVLTPAMQARIDSGQRDPKLIVEKAALRRFVQPADVGEAIWFLCSEAAGAITGVTLPVDCGWLATSAYTAYAAVPE